MLVYLDLKADSMEAAAYRDAISTAKIADVDLSYEIDAKDPANVARNADVLVGHHFSDSVLSAAASLKWIAFWGAGLDSSVTSTVRDAMKRGVIVTNASGVHGPNIAEHVLAMMLSFTRRLPFYRDAQRERIWKHEENVAAIEELAGQTLGIVGLGRIGDALASRARAFDMRVIGVKRETSQRHDSSAQVDKIFSLSDLHLLLAESDHVCIALPLTDETRHLIGDSQFAQMKKSARLYNIARGPIVDEAALVRALKTKTIAGAGLDVFEEEPLSKSSGLWEMENVILTPHVSGITPRYFERAASLFAANLRRFARGEPLENRFDAARGY